MTKSMHSPEHRKLCEMLAELRESKGLKQRELAERLDFVRSQIANIELGQRRIDLIELIWLCQALEVDPPKTIAKLVRELI